MSEIYDRMEEMLTDNGYDTDGKEDAIYNIILKSRLLRDYDMMMAEFEYHIDDTSTIKINQIYHDPYDVLHALDYMLGTSYFDEAVNDFVDETYFLDVDEDWYLRIDDEYDLLDEIIAAVYPDPDDPSDE